MFSDITPAKIGFIGLGLIGGSVPKGVPPHFPPFELVSFGKKKKNLPAIPVMEEDGYGKKINDKINLL